jgi:hypothetical protein
MVVEKPLQHDGSSEERRAPYPLNWIIESRCDDKHGDDEEEGKQVIHQLQKKTRNW